MVWGAGVGFTYLGVGILMQVTSYNPISFVLFLWAAVGVGVGVGCWCGLLVWAVCGLLLVRALVWAVGVGDWCGF